MTGTRHNISTWIAGISKTILIGLLVIIGIGCSDTGNEKTSDSSTADKAAMAVFNSRMAGLCEKYDKTSIIDLEERTAGKLNHPAYIAGINFECHTSHSGIQNLTIYVGWVHNTNKDVYECTSHNNNKSAIVDNYIWGKCGGLNPAI